MIICKVGNIFHYATSEEAPTLKLCHFAGQKWQYNTKYYAGQLCAQQSIMQKTL